MDYIVYSCIGLFVFLAVFEVCYLFLQIKHGGIIVRRPIEDIISKFSKKSAIQNPGGEFVLLITMGFFTCITLGNHGKDYPDEKQYASFMKHSGAEIANKIDLVGESYEEFVI